MIFKNFRLKRRLLTARGLLAQENYEDAQACFVSILNADPAEFVLVSARAGLAETEFSLGSISNARYYAGLYIEQVEGSPELARVPELKNRLDDMYTYIQPKESVDTENN